MSDEVDDRPEGAIGATKLDPRLAIVLAEGDGGTWPVAALAGLATKAYPRMATMLRRLEWAGGGGYEDPECCPVCTAVHTSFIGDPREGCGKHYQGCDLATLLRELP